jgi:hypothetical protein
VEDPVGDILPEFGLTGTVLKRLFCDLAIGPRVWGDGKRVKDGARFDPLSPGLVQ